MNCYEATPTYVVFLQHIVCVRQVCDNQLSQHSLVSLSDTNININPISTTELSACVTKTQTLTASVPLFCQPRRQT